MKLFQFANNYITLQTEKHFVFQPYDVLVKLDDKIRLPNEIKTIYYSEELSWMETVAGERKTINPSLVAKIELLLKNIENYTLAEKVLDQPKTSSGNQITIVDSLLSRSLLNSNAFRQILANTGKSSRLSAQYNTMLAGLTIPLTVLDVALSFNACRAIIQTLSSVEDISVEDLKELKMILELLDLPGEEINYFDLSPGS
jgi:hypothetical protein